MLITFSCEVYKNVVMFGDVGRRLLDMMGYGGTLNGIIRVDDIASVRSRLRNALDHVSANQTEQTTANNNPNQDDDENSKVSLEHRAFPLFDMFDAAEKEKCDITWTSS